MRPLLVLWLQRHGLPGFLAPNYFILVGISTLIACAIVMRHARKDGADPHIETRTLIVAYLGALVGGYVLEGLRAVPASIAAHSLKPILSAGRAAYGGLLMATLGAALYRFHVRAPLGPFFDRVSLVLGIVYLAVRGGCFLAGCDYGSPTASELGVRFPPRSLAAIDHASRGFVPLGAPSLPVHPTQLYEGGMAVVASLVAYLVFRGGHRDGRAFAVWAVMYSIGRFCIEFLRGDVTRGLYLGLSSAQYISLTICVAVAVLTLAVRQGWIGGAAPQHVQVRGASS